MAARFFRSQQGSLRRISSLGALGEGSGWDLRIRPPAPAPAPAPPAAAAAPPGPKPGPKWVGPRGPKWVGPRGAQVGGPHVGPTHEKNGGKFLKIFFTHEKMEADFGPQKIKKIKVLKIKIRSAQIVGEVFFYAGERRPRPIWGPPGPFFP